MSFNIVDSSSVKSVGTVGPTGTCDFSIVKDIARGAWYAFQTPFVIARNMHERK